MAATLLDDPPLACQCLPPRRHRHAVIDHDPVQTALVDLQADETDGEDDELGGHGPAEATEGVVPAGTQYLEKQTDDLDLQQAEEESARDGHTGRGGQPVAGLEGASHVEPNAPTGQ